MCLGSLDGSENRRGVERHRVQIAASLCGSLFPDQVGQLVPEHPRHVGNRRIVRTWREPGTHLDPVREAILQKIIEFLAFQPSRSPPEFTDQFLRYRNFPLLNSIAIPERHFVLPSSRDEGLNGRTSGGDQHQLPLLIRH